MEKKGKEKRSLVRLGLIYSIERNQFDVVYKDLNTKRIKIGLSENRESKETSPAISVS